MKHIIKTNKAKVTAKYKNIIIALIKHYVSGLTQEAVRMTETLFQSGMDLNPSNTNDILTPPECILRHWQFAHNQHSMGLQAKAPPYPCSTDNLIQILDEMERHDLVHLLQHQHIGLDTPPPVPYFPRHP